MSYSSFNIKTWTVFIVDFVKRNTQKIRNTLSLFMLTYMNSLNLFEKRNYKQKLKETDNYDPNWLKLKETIGKIELYRIISVKSLYNLTKGNIESVYGARQETRF